MSIRKLARSLLPGQINDLIYARRNWQQNKKLYLRILSLPIEKSGVSEDGIPFIKLKNSFLFYGYEPTRWQVYVYRYFADQEVKASVKESAFNVAVDILIRFIGPESKDDHIAQGKYYDVEKGSTVVEVGAYIGYYSMRMARIVGQQGCVVAIEAVAENLKLIEKNIEANNLKNIIIVHQAVWNEKIVRTVFRKSRQEVSFFKNIVNTDKGLRVQANTLDNILKSLDIKNIDFIRIQINGAEIEAIEGMPYTLSTFPKLLIAAIYQRDGRPAHEIIQSKLTQLGYESHQKNGNVFAWRN